MYIFALILFCIGIFLQQSEKKHIFHWYFFYSYLKIYISAGWRERTPSNPGGEQHEQQHGQLEEVEVMMSLMIHKHFTFFFKRKYFSSFKNTPSNHIKSQSTTTWTAPGRTLLLLVGQQYVIGEQKLINNMVCGKEIKTVEKENIFDANLRTEVG